MQDQTLEMTNLDVRYGFLINTAHTIKQGNAQLLFRINSPFNHVSLFKGIHKPFFDFLVSETVSLKVHQLFKFYLYQRQTKLVAVNISVFRGSPQSTKMVQRWSENHAKCAKKIIILCSYS